MRVRIFFILLLAAITSLPLSVGAEGQKTIFTPPRESSLVKATGEEPVNLATWLLSIYRKHISKVDGDRCPSFPPCSSYSVQAFRKHGSIVGWMMTVDRLFHEGSEEKDVSPLLYDRGRMKIYDPVENNDFWWFGPSREGHE